MTSGLQTKLKERAHIEKILRTFHRETINKNSLNIPTRLQVGPDCALHKQLVDLAITGQN